MAAKSAYIEKVGAVYYVRKRIPRAWEAGAGMLRLSLRTKDRAAAMRLGLGALAVFEDLLRMEAEEALKHVLRRLIDEQMLRPEAMRDDDLVRRRALGAVAAKLMRQARDEFNVNAMFPSLFEELAHFNHATVLGEQRYERAAQQNGVVRPAPVHGPAKAPIDLSAFDAVLNDLGAVPRAMEASVAATPPPEPSPPAEKTAAKPETVWTLRALMNDYFKRDGKGTGSDNTRNVERAIKMFEDLCPQVKHLPAAGIPLETWDELYEFVQLIPMQRGKQVDDLVGLTRQRVASGATYSRLSAETLNSNYTGAITRLIRHGNKRRLFKVEPPHLTIKDKKRATTSSSRAGFSPGEITAITSCSIYTGGVSAHHRYKPGNHIVFDDHIYWAPLIAMHTGMRVSEIGMLGFEQMQPWFGRQTLVLEVDPEGIDAAAAGYKTARALRRVPVHRQLTDIGFPDFWEYQKAQGHDRPFPKWTQHRKGGQNGVAEIHYEGDFFNANRLKWGVPPERQRKLTFHSFRYFFTQACHNANIDPYTILKMVGHDEDTENKTSKVHRGYLDKDLTEEEINEIDKVKVPLGRVTSFQTLLKTRRSER